MGLARLRFSLAVRALRGLAALALLALLSAIARPQEEPTAPTAPPPAAPQTAPSAPAADAAFEDFRARARDLASKDHVGPDTSDLPEWLAKLDFDGYRRIRFREDTALWTDEGLPFRTKFLHRGYLFQRRVRMDEVIEGAPRELVFHPAQFHYDDGQPAPEGLGYSGLALLHRFPQAERWDEIAAFQGASYYRLIGEGHVYGACLRGLAVDTASENGEEFPEFTDLRLLRPAPGDTTLVICALLDSPSVTGAFRLAITPGSSTSAEITASLFPRRAIGKLGLAPLTSMFVHGEDGTRRTSDWRPEVHDSDGLLVAQADGSWLWRPLANPARTHRVTRLGANSPRGFGLLQRDRDFRSYEDLESRFERRPSLWVEPVGDWGNGSVELVEIPTQAEWNDNIVAFWVPERAPAPGEELRLQYRVTARRDEPSAPVHVRATRVRPGSEVSLFVVDFDGPSPETPGLVADVTASRGELRHVVLHPNDTVGGWRCSFELAAGGDEPVELRVTLRQEGQPVSETLRLDWTRP